MGKILFVATIVLAFTGCYPGPGLQFIFIALCIGGLVGLSACSTSPSSQDGQATSQHWVRSAYLKSPNPVEGGEFGRDVRISEDRIIVAQSKAEFFETGIINENGVIPTAGLAGEEGMGVYVFEKDANGEWFQDAYLQPATLPSGADGVGGLAVNGDTIIFGDVHDDTVGTPITPYGCDGWEIYDLTPPGPDWLDKTTAGALYVFNQDALGKWQQEHFITLDICMSDYDDFGSFGLVSERTMVIGSPGGYGDGFYGTFFDNTGEIYVFEQAENGQWEQIERIRNYSETFIDVAMDEQTIVAGARKFYGGNKVYIYERFSDGWQEVLQLEPNSEDSSDFGRSVALDDTTLVVGANGVITIYHKQADGWAEQSTILAADVGVDTDTFGQTVLLEDDTLVTTAQVNSDLNGVLNEEAISTPVIDSEGDDVEQQTLAFVFRRSGDGAWSQEAIFGLGPGAKSKLESMFGSPEMHVRYSRGIDLSNGQIVMSNVNDSDPTGGVANHGTASPDASIGASGAEAFGSVTVFRRENKR